MMRNFPAELLQRQILGVRIPLGWLQNLSTRFVLPIVGDGRSLETVFIQAYLQAYKQASLERHFANGPLPRDLHALIAGYLLRDELDVLLQPDDEDKANPAHLELECRRKSALISAADWVSRAQTVCVAL